jgi:hypothetical protein
MDFDDARCCRNSNLEMVRLDDVDDVAWLMCDDIAAGATRTATASRSHSLNQPARFSRNRQVH